MITDVARGGDFEWHGKMGKQAGMGVYTWIRLKMGRVVVWVGMLVPVIGCWDDNGWSPRTGDEGLGG